MRTWLDTGPLVAVLYPRDEHHDWSKRQLRQVKPPIYTCEAVLTEAYHLLQPAPRGTQILSDFLRRIDVVVTCAFPTYDREVTSRMTKYHDLPMDFADACLVALMEDEPSEVVTVDSDFQVYRNAQGHPLDVIAPWTAFPHT